MVYRQHLALDCRHIINLFIVLKEVYLYFFVFFLNMSGFADLWKEKIVKKSLSDGTLKEYTYTAKVSKQQ